MERNKVYNTIFDAFSEIAPNSPLIQLKSDNARFFKRTNRYELIDMGGYIGAFPGFPFRLFRGEHSIFPSCKAIANDIKKLLCNHLDNVVYFF